MQQKWCCMTSKAGSQKGPSTTWPSLTLRILALESSHHAVRKPKLTYMERWSGEDLKPRATASIDHKKCEWMSPQWILTPHLWATPANTQWSMGEPFWALPKVQIHKQNKRRYYFNSLCFKLSNWNTDLGLDAHINEFRLKQNKPYVLLSTLIPKCKEK